MHSGKKLKWDIGVLHKHTRIRNYLEATCTEEEKILSLKSTG
jgi:hypothetical protein